jgi:hypothetical protein
MKKHDLLFTLWLLITSSFVFLVGCNNNAGKSDEAVVNTGSGITEAVLPPGKPVLEDEAKFVAPPENTIQPAHGINDNGSTRSSSNSPAEETKTDRLKKKYKNLLVFHADDTMEVNKPRLATLILGKDETIERLQVQVLEQSEAGDDRIKSDTTMEFGSKMRARLIAFGGSRLENSFEIEALGSEEQSFRADRKKIIWQWKVTPLKPGQHDLKLSIQVIEKDGEAVSLPARNIPVTIFAKEVSFMSKVGNFLENKFEWVITAILIPILIAWFTARMKYKSSNKKGAKQVADND